MGCWREGDLDGPREEQTGGWKRSKGWEGKTQSSVLLKSLDALYSLLSRLQTHVWVASKEGVSRGCRLGGWLQARRDLSADFVTRRPAARARPADGRPETTKSFQTTAKFPYVKSFCRQSALSCRLSQTLGLHGSEGRGGRWSGEGVRLKSEKPRSGGACLGNSSRSLLPSAAVLPTALSDDESEDNPTLERQQDDPFILSHPSTTRLVHLPQARPRVYGRPKRPSFEEPGSRRLARKRFGTKRTSRPPQPQRYTGFHCGECKGRGEERELE